MDKNYKGIFYNNDNKKNYYEFGAHFKYKELFNKLLLLQKLQKNENKSNININTQKSSININKNNLNKSNLWFKTTTINIIYPKFLIINFDLENSGDINLNYNNLKNNQSKILALLNYNISLENKNYNLIGSINMLDYNHYSSIVINSKIEIAYISKYKNFYNDVYINDSEIISEDFNFNNLYSYMENNIIISAFYLLD